MSAPNRNEPCPCGSGKKYKHCCLNNAAAAPKTTNLWGVVQPITAKTDIPFDFARRTNPAHPPAYYINLGNAFMGQGNHKAAIENYRSALALKPDSAEVHCSLGYALQLLGNLNDAVECYRTALALKPNFSGAHSNLGLALQAQGNLVEATKSFRKAIALQADFADAHFNLGIVLKEQGKLDEAIISYRRTLALQPNDDQAYYNLGNALKDTGKLDEAAASYRKAISFRQDYAEAHNNLGNVYSAQGKLEEAVYCFNISLSLNPYSAEGHLSLGLVQTRLGRHEQAIASFQNAITIKPDYTDAYNNLFFALIELKRINEAIGCYQKALAIKPDFGDAYNNIGNALCSLQRHDKAIPYFQKTLTLDPDYLFAFGQLLHSKQYCCDWNQLDEIFEAILIGIDSGKAVSIPFPILAIPSNSAQQKRCAEIYIQTKYPAIHGISGSIIYPHKKIRLGYFSSDFYNHATAYLIAELLERHDRTRFEVFGFSFGLAPNDDMRQRVSTAFDRFVDVQHMSDQDIANLARSLEIDIAIDLKGITAGARTGIFALRPAPIQISYLGYPGTMGAPYIDYLIADPTLIPVEQQRHYSEKIVYLPNTYQVNDSHKRIAERQFTRAEVGLPDTGFVFCCFNNNFKITPVVFDIWMQLLKQVKGSVLWLFDGNAKSTLNLRNEAIARGIAAERIVFAKRMDLPEHLARHKLADLFLDTFFYNAHTTASDALWSGLPVITCIGETFASRVAASLLNAIGMPELITHSSEEYLSLALALATDPERLASIRQKLEKNRSTHPLFNTRLFTRHIENAYTQMWKQHQASLLPDHIYVNSNGQHEPISTLSSIIDAPDK